MTSTPMIPGCCGDSWNKITILQIKQERLDDDAKRANVATELAALLDPAGGAMALAAAPMAELKAVNETLWEVEDRIRDKERDGAFDGEFIELARAVYVTNDR